MFVGGWLSNVGPQASELDHNNNSWVVSKKCVEKMARWLLCKEQRSAIKSNPAIEGEAIILP